MVIVDLVKTQDEYILNVSGHALFAPIGEDIVCAGISSIIFGALNAFDSMLENVQIEVNSKIQVICAKEQLSDDLFLFLMIQLKTVASSYPNNILIKEGSR